jgi:peptidoglycan DL-endopeptidase CwlO
VLEHLSPRHLPAAATRAAVVATATAAACLLPVLPTTAWGTSAIAAPAGAPVAGPAVTFTLQVTPAAHAAAAAAPVAARSSAVQNALAKIGAPYRWGATGPDAFDCSGLVKWAFAQEGVSLPRTSRAMSRVGTPVSMADLRPGDLVFFYRPVSHVGIYIGDGKIVHASNRKSPVKISDIGRMPFHSARRI